MEPIIKSIQNSDFFIIAEVALNHDGSLGNAFRLIEEAKNAGVNAVKFQLHISEEERLKNMETPPYFKLEDRNEYFDRTSFSLKEWVKLQKYAHELNLYFIVSPFSHAAVNILEDVNIDAYKIASGETTNIPLLEYINIKNRPILLSTGMSNWEEINNAIDIVKKNLIVLFQCSSQYPCSPENLGLNIIEDFRERFKELVIGYSDHTIGNYSSIAAYIMGAKVFEKHFTLSKTMYGPDAKVSLEPEELENYVQGIAYIAKALKNPVDKDNINLYEGVKKKYEKSIVATRDLEKGHILEFSDLAFKKPGDGIRADKYGKIIGKILLKNIKKNEKILFHNIISN
ncbi:MAG: N-acetylneuraminate synthase family protein [Candidatus Hodarchaeota archaeon]